MTIKFTNNASGALASSIGTSTTSIVLQTGQGALFPSLTVGDYFYATLVDSSNNLEIIKVTARSSDTLTATRAQDGTTARSFIAGDKVELRPVAADFGDIVTLIEDHIADTVAAHAATAIANTPAGGIAATTVQAAIDELDSEKFPKAGGAITGATTVTASGADAIKGSTDGATKFGVIAENTNSGTTITFKMAGANSSNRLFQGLKNSSEVIGCDEDGNLDVVGSFTSTSDERLKTNWADLPSDFVERLSEVKHGSYDRTDIVARQVGVSAQSLRNVIPEAVDENAEGMLAVAYGNAALVAAIELAKEVRLLKAQVKALKG